MKLTNVSTSKALAFTKENFPVGTFFKFCDEIFIVLKWEEKEASVLELDTENTMEFVESKFPDYRKVSVQEITYSVD